MNPAYWIAICGLAGALLGFLINRLTGWLDTTAGLAAGVLIGALVYSAMIRRKPRE